MDAVILMDADSSIFQSCLTKVEETEDGKGFIYEIKDAQHKFEEKVYAIINTLEEQYSFNILHTILFLENRGNYRYGINPSYKANRKERERPPLLSHLQSWVVENFNKESQPLSTFLSVNVETDDSIAATYKKYHLNDSGVQLIIASPDKDMKTLPCLLFDSFHKRMELSSISEVEAHSFLMRQMIEGDKADGVDGIPNKGKAFVNKIFKGCETKIHYTYVVWMAYKEHYGVRAKEYWYKNYVSLKLNDKNINTPNINQLIF